MADTSPYQSKLSSDPPVYHVCKKCPTGQRIQPINRERADLRREKCDHCKEMEKSGSC